MKTVASVEGFVCTFYSYKGGVGRSMALANVAALLARWGQRVLIVDWDLEAPGIHAYFRKWLAGSPRVSPGIVDLIAANGSQQPLDWHTCLLHINLPGAQPIHLISAGRDDDTYLRRLRSIHWDVEFQQHGLGNYLERLRDEWRNEYATILIDSRTGITDAGGVCTIHLPDALVAMFTSSEGVLDRLLRVLESARRGHNELGVDRSKLLVVPVLARDESGSEYELSEKWKDHCAMAFSPYLEDWVPKRERNSNVLNILKVPYSAYWSFGERLPVVEQEDADNPKTLAFAYQPLARLLMARLDWRKVRQGARAHMLAVVREAEAGGRGTAEELELRRQVEELEQRRRAEGAERVREMESLRKIAMDARNEAAEARWAAASSRFVGRLFLAERRVGRQRMLAKIERWAPTAATLVLGGVIAVALWPTWDVRTSPGAMVVALGEAGGIGVLAASISRLWSDVRAVYWRLDFLARVGRSMRALRGMIDIGAGAIEREQGLELAQRHCDDLVSILDDYSDHATWSSATRSRLEQKLKML